MDPLERLRALGDQHAAEATPTEEATARALDRVLAEVPVADLERYFAEVRDRGSVARRVVVLEALLGGEWRVLLTQPDSGAVQIGPGSDPVVFGFLGSRPMVGHPVDVDEDGEWIETDAWLDEGPHYRTVVIEGHERHMRYRCIEG